MLRRFLPLMVAAMCGVAASALTPDAGPEPLAATDAGLPPPPLLPCVKPTDEGCLQLASALALGTGMPRDPSRAATLYSHACEAGRGDACRGLGALFEAGNGTATSFSTAFRFLSRACELGDAVGCLEGAALLIEGVGVKQNLEEAARLLQHGCELGSAPACLRGAGLADLKLSSTDAGELYRKACAGGEKAACFNSETSLSQQTDACEQANDALACWILGDIYLDGTGVKKAPATAARFYGRACDAGEGEACASLAELYATGKGVPKSAKQAIGYYRRACKQGDDEACAKIAKPPRR